MLSLRAAAEMAGTSKSSIFRAIRSGRLSAARGDDGGYLIDPAELSRVFSPQVSRPERAGNVSPGQTEAATGTDDLALRNASLQGEVKALSTEVRLLREAVDRLERDRDRWHAQAARVARGPPQPSAPQPTPAQPPARCWWSWRRAG